tara:strand:+ start:158 stop:868 length:711 start_codon:yes stop_codon:yes gene_type:complete
MSQYPNDNRRSFRQLIKALEHMPAITVLGAEYDGLYLSQLVSVRYSPPAEAADDTPQLMSELGTIVAQAKAQLDDTELDYRIWRDTTLFQIMNSLDAAERAGFACVTSPGKYANGKDKAAALPSKTEAESYLRTLPEYRTHWDSQRHAQLAWSTLHLALEAAKVRTHALNISSRWGLASPEAASDNSQTSPGPTYEPPPRDVQSAAGSSTVQPPPPPAIPGAGPPPPPPASGDQSF